MRTTIAAITAASAIAVAACGGSGGGGSAPVSGGKATGTINVWAWGNEGEILTKLTKDFEAENPRREGQRGQHPPSTPRTTRSSPASPATRRPTWR